MDEFISGLRTRLDEYKESVDDLDVSNEMAQARVANSIDVLSTLIENLITTEIMFTQFQRVGRLALQDRVAKRETALQVLEEQLELGDDERLANKDDGQEELQELVTKAVNDLEFVEREYTRERAVWEMAPLKGPIVSKLARKRETDLKPKQERPEFLSQHPPDPIAAEKIVADPELAGQYLIVNSEGRMYCKCCKHTCRRTEKRAVKEHCFGKTTRQMLYLKRSSYNRAGFSHGAQLAAFQRSGQ